MTMRAISRVTTRPARPARPARRRNHRARGTAVVMAAGLLGGALTACAPASGTTLGVNMRAVNPCVTQAAITCDPVSANVVMTPTGFPLNKLVVLFNGTGAAPYQYQKLTSRLGDAGYHVIALRYRSLTGTKEACPDAAAATDPDCHRTFRSELVFGAGVADPSGASFDHPTVDVSGTESVTNRLLQLVNYLSATFPTEGWGQYLNALDGQCNLVDPTYGACDLDWSKVVAMGHSLGSGVALYLSKFHDVDRLAMISGPFDEYRAGNTFTVAPWIAEGGFATPSVDMFGLTHTSEPNARGQSAAWNSLGLAGPQTSVDGGTSPFGGVHQLSTARTPACTNDPTNGAHNSTAQDACVVGTPALLGPAWVYLAGG